MADTAARSTSGAKSGYSPLRRALGLVDPDPAAPLPETTDRLGSWCIAGAFLCVVAVIAETAVDAIPDDPIVWVLTPLRLIVITGLALAFAARPLAGTVHTRNDLWIIVLLLAAGLSVFTSGGSGAIWRGLLTGVAVYYLVVALRRAGGVGVDLGLFTALAVAGLASAAVGVAQTVNETPTGFCRSLIYWSHESCDAPGTIDRAMGTHTNPNLLAAYLLLIGPLVVWVGTRTRERYTRLLAYGAAACVLLALIMTVSRIAIFAVFFAAGVWWALRRPATWRIAATVVAGAGVLAACAFAVLRGGGFGLRTDLYVASAKALRDNPFGVGIGNAGTVMQTYVPDSLDFAHAHNLWLNWLVELGLVGLAVWLIMPVLLAVQLVRAARAGDDQAPYVAAALTGFFIASIFDHAANTSRIEYPMWILFAIAATAIPGRSGAMLDEKQRAREPFRRAPATHASLMEAAHTGAPHARDDQSQTRPNDVPQPVGSAGGGAGAAVSTGAMGARVVPAAYSARRPSPVVRTSSWARTAWHDRPEAGDEQPTGAIDVTTTEPRAENLPRG